MAEGEEYLGTAAPRGDSEGAHDGMRVVWRTSGKRREKSAERLDSVAEMKAREGDIRCLSRVAVVERSGSVKGELEKKMKNHYSFIVSSQ